MNGMRKLRGPRSPSGLRTGLRRGSRLALAGGLALVVALGASACGRSPTQAGSEILGSWQWVRATGGIGGQVLTPASEGYTMELHFLAGGVVELFRDAELQTRTSYQLLPPSGDSAPYRRVSYGEPVFGTDVQYLVQADAEGLILRDPCCDRYVWEFQPPS